MYEDKQRMAAPKGVATNLPNTICFEFFQKFRLLATGSWLFLVLQLLRKLLRQRNIGYKNIQNEPRNHRKKDERQSLKLTCTLARSAGRHGKLSRRGRECNACHQMLTCEWRSRPCSEGTWWSYGYLTESTDSRHDKGGREGWKIKFPSSVTVFGCSLRTKQPLLYIVSINYPWRTQCIYNSEHSPTIQIDGCKK